jgi:ubiquinone/menaquinone biosynthesis C-methylase UbiE
MSSTQTPTVDQALAAKHRAMWATGDYPKLADDLVSPLGPVLVEACAIGPGDQVLDVAAGTGNAAIPAAATGATVIASDLTPELLHHGQVVATERGIHLQWQEANAEVLPFTDDQFDTVISCIGVMFAPHHQRCADELVRVARPGATIGVLSWTPEGFIGQLFATMKPFMAAPPPGAQPPPLWGSEEHVRELFGDRVTDLTTQRLMLAVDYFRSGEDLREYYKAYYGPTIAAYRNIEDDPDRVAALDAALDELGQRYLRPDAPMEWEYLLVTARKL